jgi:hypothetical protein
VDDVEGILVFFGNVVVDVDVDVVVVVFFVVGLFDEKMNDAFVLNFV